MVGLQERQSIGQHAQLPQLACARGADRPSRRCAIGAGTLPAWALARSLARSLYKTGLVAEHFGTLPTRICG